MVNLPQFFREQFRFTTMRHMEARYYREPLWKSRYFRNNTITMICALLTGIFTAGHDWQAMPWLASLFLLVSLACMIGVWIRTIVDHAQAYGQLDKMPDESAREELLKIAAGGANFGPSAMYIIVLLLIFALAFTIAHYQHLLAVAMRAHGN